MTRTELETALAKIGWRIAKSGNGLNDYIINHRNKETEFVVNDNILEVRASLFGGSSNLGLGTCVFHIIDITISCGGNTEDSNETEWVALHFSKNNFIQFYNHDKP